MNEAVGEEEGRAGAASAREVLGGIQDFDFSSDRMRRRIMSSGTREPDCMCDSASWPGRGIPLEQQDHIESKRAGSVAWVDRDWSNPTAFCCEQHCAKDPQS